MESRIETATFCSEFHEFYSSDGFCYPQVKNKIKLFFVLPTYLRTNVQDFIKKTLFEKKLTFLDHFFKITVLSPIFILPKLVIFDDFEEKSWLEKFAKLLHVLGRGAYK